MLHNVSRPKELLLNTAQVIDFLPAQKRVLVDSWTHVYSSRARTVDASMTFAHERNLCDWIGQGLPGKGLGGMESNLLTDQNMPGYSIDVAHAAELSHDAAAKRPVVIAAFAVSAFRVGHEVFVRHMEWSV